MPRGPFTPQTLLLAAALLAPILAPAQQPTPPTPTTSTTIQVTTTPAQIANEQIHQEEKQRVFLIFPNSYSTYIWQAAPLAPHNKFQLALKTTTDPVAFITSGALAGVEQYHDTFPGYGLGAQGYAKRFGAAYADSVSGRFISSAILPTLFHQDPRYFYKGTGTIPSRTTYALSQAIVCRGDNGHTQPNYSLILGTFAASALAELYRAPSDRGASLVIRNGFVGIGVRAAGNLLREFVFRHVSNNVPTYEKGKAPITP